MKTEIEKGLFQLKSDIKKSNQEIETQKKLFIKNIKKADKSKMFVGDVKVLKEEKKGLLWRIQKVLGLI